jgi:adhesin HecA-like repeat protein
MAEIKLPDIRPAKTIEGKMDALYDAYFVMRKFMTYYLSGNLDEENVVRAQEAVIANVLAGTIKADQIDVTEGKIQAAQIGTIKADQIDVTEGKIQAAQIEDLVVGGNVTMGPNATISWSKITDQPTIPSQYTDAQALNAWKNSGYATWINANGVYSGAFNGGMFNINPMSDPALESGLTIGGWYNGSWKGQALKVQYEEYWNMGFPGTIVSSLGGVPLIFDLETCFDDYVRFRSGSVVSFRGNVDFTGANVTGLSVP